MEDRQKVEVSLRCHCGRTHLFDIEITSDISLVNRELVVQPTVAVHDAQDRVSLRVHKR